MIRFLQCVHIKKIHGIYRVRRAEERGCVVFWVTGPVFSAFRAANKQGQFLSCLIGSLWRDFSRTRFE
jgi:hypothetical protein